MKTKEWLGVLDVKDNGAGFIRRRESGYVPAKSDIYVPPRLVKKYQLRTGDEVAGVAGRAPAKGKHAALEELVSVNDREPASIRDRPSFHDLSAVHPDEQLRLEYDTGHHKQPDLTNRIIDLFCPFGKGQRAMIVAPSKAGKTTVLQSVAAGIVANYPDCALLLLLVDERPEEITEMEMCGNGEVVASSFDHPAQRHVAVAELTLERARRRVELGEDVVVVLDSITRLARACNTIVQGTGRTMSGGLDAAALDKPKRLLGSARKVSPAQGGGSLTIVATALVDTGSRMDEVIFEEFKGTGNSELVLSRELADRRIFPAIDLTISATRREELLLSSEALAVAHTLRRKFADMPAEKVMTELQDIMRQTGSNAELLRAAGKA